MMSLTPAANYAVDIYPEAVVAADFNNDGHLDLATANAGSDSVSVLLGSANGTFGSPMDSPAGDSPRSIAVGDFDGDGILDLATAGGYGVSGEVSVLLGIDDGTGTGDGSGSFEAPTSVGIGSSPTSVAVGDFNGDGTVDLGVTSNSYYYYGYGYYGYNYGNANVLLGNGDGSFSGPNITPLGYGYFTSAAVADFNGDTIDDIVTANYDYGTVSVLVGDSSGYLQGPADFYSGYSSWSVAAEDLDGDGDNDLVVANLYGNNVSVLLGTDGGGFAAPQSYATGSATYGVAAGDFNGDGWLDVATANYNSNEVGILRGLGDGSFAWPEHFAAGSGTYGVAAGDFNGDGWLDVATANAAGNSVSVLFNDQTWAPLPPPVSISVADARITEGKRGTKYLTFTVSLSAASDDQVTVSYAMQEGTATAWSDYVPESGTLTFAAGETTKTVQIAIYGDRTIEPDESFQLVLNNQTGNAVITDSLGVGLIVNDDVPRGRGRKK